MPNNVWENIRVGNIVWWRHRPGRDGRHSHVVVGRSGDSVLLLAFVTSKIFKHARDEDVVFLDGSEHPALDRKSAVLTQTLVEMPVCKFLEDWGVVDELKKSHSMIEINPNDVLPAAKTKEIIESVLASKQIINKHKTELKMSLQSLQS